MFKTFEQDVISLPTSTENSISFSQDGLIVFLTRTDDWSKQSGYIGVKREGKFGKLEPISTLNSIYNGALSPDGTKIVYSIKKGSREEIWLIRKSNNEWINPISLTKSTGIEGGYFNWRTNNDIYFQLAKNNGDIARATLEDDKFSLLDTLSVLNTSATEFSPYIDKNQRFIIFTRYLVGDISNQGFFELLTRI